LLPHLLRPLSLQHHELIDMRNHKLVRLVQVLVLEQDLMACLALEQQASQQ
jgi:hypothetical protein